MALSILTATDTGPRILAGPSPSAILKSPASLFSLLLSLLLSLLVTYGYSPSRCVLLPGQVTQARAVPVYASDPEPGRPAVERLSGARRRARVARRCLGSLMSTRSLRRGPVIVAGNYFHRY